MKSQKALTLIELLVTIAVVAIVAVISVPVVNNVLESSRNNSATAMEMQVENFIAKHSEAGQVSYDETSRIFTAWVDSDSNGTYASPSEIVATLAVPEEFYIDVDNLNSPNSVTVAPIGSTYTLAYDANYAEGIDPTSSTKPKGSTIVVANSPENRTGYTFVEWNTNANGSGTSYAAGSNLTLSSNITLYAIWSAEVYTVSYNYNGGTGGDATATYTFGESGLILPAPNRSGHSFDGWFDNQALSGSPLTSPYSPAGNTTLYAKWTSTSFVVFDASTGPNSAVTGGWNNFYTGGTTNSIMSVTSEYIALRGPYWTDGVAQTNNNINMTGAKSITIVVSASNVSPAHFYSSFGWANTSGGYSGFGIGNPGNANFGLTTHTIPVTDAGNGKLRLYVTNSNSGYVYLYSVVINY